MAESGLTAKHLTDMLRAHYQPPTRQPTGVFAPEIQSPCGKRRADLIFMPTTIAGGKGELVGHEIKVSRQDILVELADPTKADPWGQFCTRWWLVVAHPGLIADLAIPEAWGVMAPPSGRRTRTMTIVRPAPKLTPANPAPGMARLAAWMLYADFDNLVETRRRLAQAERTVARQETEISTLRAGGARPDKRAERVASIVTAVEAATSQSRFLWRDVDDRLIVAAILDAATTADLAESARDSVRRMLRTVESLHTDHLKYVIEELRDAEKLGSTRNALAATAATAAAKAHAVRPAGFEPDTDGEPELAAAVTAIQAQFPGAG